MSSIKNGCTVVLCPKVTNKQKKVMSGSRNHCSVSSCTSNYLQEKKEGKLVRFFSFPTNQELKKEWINKCNCKHNFNLKNAKICSKHFINDDYEDEIQAKIMGYKPRFLKKHAIPSVDLLPPEIAKTESKSPGKSWKEKLEALEKEYEDKEKKSLYEAKLWKEQTKAEQKKNMVEFESWKAEKKALEKKYKDEVEALEQKYKNEVEAIEKKFKDEVKAVQNKHKYDAKLWKAEKKVLEKKYKELSQKATKGAVHKKFIVGVKSQKAQMGALKKMSCYEVKLWKQKAEAVEKKYMNEVKSCVAEKESLENKYKDRFKSWKATMEAVEEKYRGEIVSWKATTEALHKKIKDDTSTFDKKVKAAFSHLFSPSQVDIILKKKTRARWTEGELFRAFNLRSFGLRTYDYLRDTCQYPLPGASALKTWTDNLKLHIGIWNDVLNKMEISGSSKTEMEKVTVLLFDKMKIANKYKNDDSIIGSHMLVIMACGLFDNWKQLVYVSFDELITKELLTSVITSLHNINFPVVACVSDCGSGNEKLWKELEITFNKPYIFHPRTEHKIYFFADIPQLLILIRNWLINTGFKLKDGKFVKIEPIQELLKTTNKEILSCLKLSFSHIHGEHKNPNVKLAAELMSNTISQDLIRYLPGNNPELAFTTGEFIGLTNKWFDIGNSYSLFDKVPLKRAFGVHLDDQRNVLNKMISTINEMRCIGEQSLQFFQIGVIVSSISLKGLYNDMKNKYNTEYIFTQQLNQDCLRDLFSQIRLDGGHQSPMSAMYHLRMILLSKNSVVTEVKTTVGETDCQEIYVVSSAIPKARISVINEALDALEIREVLEIDKYISVTNMEREDESSAFGSTSTSVLSAIDVEHEELKCVEEY